VTQVLDEEGRRDRRPRLVIILGIAAVVVLGLLGFKFLRGGSDAPTSRSTAKFCGTLREIKASAEAPPGPDPTHGAAGLKLLAKRYDELELVAPRANLARWLAEARPLLGHGLVSFTPTVRAAIPSAEKLRNAVEDTCGIDVSDVFKVGFT
jgi:hypothetical protein